MKNRLILFLWLTVSLIGFTGCSSLANGSSAVSKGLVGYEVYNSGEGTTAFTAEFTFNPSQSFNVQEEVDASTDTQTVKLFINDYMYYPIILPADTEYITDYNSYIYAKDNSFSVMIINNTDPGQLSTMSLIPNAELLTQNVIRSKEGSRGMQEAACYISDSKAAVLRTYDNPVVFATALSGFLTKEKVSIIEQTIRINTDEQQGVVTSVYDTLSDFIEERGLNTQSVSVLVNIDNTVQRIYNYETGSLIVLLEYKKYDDAVKKMLTKLTTISENIILDTYVKTGRGVYLESADFTVGVVNVNYNTSVTLWGVGSEARDNVLAYMMAQEEINE